MKKKFRTEFQTRQVMTKDDFEIYYYNDTETVKVSSHVHRHFELYFYLEGNTSYEIKGVEYPLEYGDIVVIPPGVPHHAVLHNVDVPYRRFVVWVSDKLGLNMYDIFPSVNYIKTRPDDWQEKYIFHCDKVTYGELLHILFQMLEEQNSREYGRDDLLLLRLTELTLLICRIMDRDINPKGRQREKELYEKVMMYISDHLEEEMSLDLLASLFYVSKYHLAHNFKENMGLSIHQYILKKRLSACADAILLNEKISEVYLMYGFNDYPSFFRAFRKEYGMSPREYRDAAGIPTVTGADPE